MTDDSPIHHHSELNATTRDQLVALGKSALGMIPVAGTALGELLGAVIPSQRLQRIVTFAETLEARLGDLEVLRSKFTDEHFASLCEEVLRQASQALSPERREYLSTLLVRSLSAEDISHDERRHVLRILEELGDVELLWLRLYLCQTMIESNAYRSKHSEIFKIERAYIGCPPDVLERWSRHEAFRESYLSHLERLHLVSPRYDTDIRTGQPRFNSMTGGQEVSGYSITDLGRLLLREIGLDR